MMKVVQTKQPDGSIVTIVASIPTEDIIVRSSVDYIPQYVTDVFGKTSRVTKDVTLCNLLNSIKNDYPSFDLVSIGTPVNFDIAPTHLTRVVIDLKSQEQVVACLKEISVSDLLIRTRVQPAWTWEAPIKFNTTVILHVAWFDTVYFLQFKDIFLGNLHCRYSAKFGFDPKDANITHYRYDDHGNLEKIVNLNQNEISADAIKDKVEFLRVFRDGTQETT
ncbi:MULTISPECIES: hypothetical protein [Enterobacter]|nr:MULTISPECIES: hypothetical protein [Enterobacter]WRT52665.1 hypothetical protein VK758_06155 [Enterobacter bugandensis]